MTGLASRYQPRTFLLFELSLIFLIPAYSCGSDGNSVAIFAKLVSDLKPWPIANRTTVHKPAANARSSLKGWPWPSPIRSGASISLTWRRPTGMRPTWRSRRSTGPPARAIFGNLRVKKGFEGGRISGRLPLSPCSSHPLRRPFCGLRRNLDRTGKPNASAAALSRSQPDDLRVWNTRRQIEIGPARAGPVREMEYQGCKQ